MLTLKPIGAQEAKEAQTLVRAAFLPLVQIYHDGDQSPANKPLERFERALSRPQSQGYMFMLSGEAIGYARVDRYGEGCYSLSDVCVLPAYQNRGLGQEALLRIEALYPDARLWSLVTIAQEARDVHLYEKLGYARIGVVRQVHEAMTLCLYLKFSASGACIRPMRPEDFDDVHTLVADTHALHRQNRPDIYTDADFFDRAYFDALVGDDTVDALVAHQDGHAVGLCVLKQRCAADLALLKQRHFAFIDDLCVAQAYRRRGIGRRLMDAAVQLARARGLSSVELNVWGFNQSAIAFYQSLGMTCMRMQMEMKL